MREALDDVVSSLVLIFFATFWLKPMWLEALVNYI